MLQKNKDCYFDNSMVGLYCLPFSCNLNVDGKKYDDIKLSKITNERIINVKNVFFDFH